MVIVRFGDSGLSLLPLFLKKDFARFKVLVFCPALTITCCRQETCVQHRFSGPDKRWRVKADEEGEECYLVPLKIGSAAGGEALLAAEALQLTAHAQGVALHADLLAPGAHDLHVGRIVVWKTSASREKQSGWSSGSGCELMKMSKCSFL